MAFHGVRYVGDRLLFRTRLGSTRPSSMMILTPEELAYLSARGFEPSEGYRFLIRFVLRPGGQGTSRQTLTPTLQSMPGDPTHWVAGADTLGTDGIPTWHLVVGSLDNFADPITCYVTAEIRNWRRP